MNFKIGDTVRCKPGFVQDCDNGATYTYGGKGYKEGQVFKISKFTSSTHGENIAWGDTKNGCGVFVQALELVENKTYSIFN